MWTRSTAYDAAIAAGGVVVTTASVIRTNPGLASTTVLSDLELLPGAEIQVDGTAAIRRSFRGSIADPTGALFPKLQGDPLAPFGNELVVGVGFRYIDGTTETVPVGVFRLDDAVSNQIGQIAVTGRDRASVIQAAKFETPYTIASGTNLGTAVRAILSSRYPGILTYNFAATSLTLPLTVFEEGTRSGDPWQNAQDLAVAGGFILYFAPDGSAVMAPIPDPVARSSVWTYAPGPQALIVGAEESLTAKGVANVIVLQVEGTGQTANWRSVAAVSDAASPIYPSGPFGRRPQFVLQAVPIITTQAQIDAIAAGLLTQAAGGGEQLQFGAAPHPAHDADDVVFVSSPVLPGGGAYCVLSSFALDVGMQKAVTYTTRGRRSS